MILLNSRTVTATIEIRHDLTGARTFWVMVEALPILGTDRRAIMGWSCGGRASARRLASRLQAAILAGKAFGPASVKTDVNGQTYLSADALVMGRHMDADLHRLGF